MQARSCCSILLQPAFVCPLDAQQLSIKLKMAVHGFSFMASGLRIRTFGSGGNVGDCAVLKICGFRATILIDCALMS